MVSRKSNFKFGIWLCIGWIIIFVSVQLWWANDVLWAGGFFFYLLVLTALLGITSFMFKVFMGKWKLIRWFVVCLGIFSIGVASVKFNSMIWKHPAVFSEPLIQSIESYKEVHGVYPEKSPIPIYSRFLGFWYWPKDDGETFRLMLDGVTGNNMKIYFSTEGRWD